MRNVALILVPLITYFILSVFYTVVLPESLSYHFLFHLGLGHCQAWTEWAPKHYPVDPHDRGNLRSLLYIFNNNPTYFQWYFENHLSTQCSLIFNTKLSIYPQCTVCPMQFEAHYGIGWDPYSKCFVKVLTALFVVAVSSV